MTRSQLLRWMLAAAASPVPHLAFASKPWPPSGWPKLDAGRLRLGRFGYRVTENGTALGMVWIAIRRLGDGTYRISMDSADLSQHWTTDLTRHFQPRSARLTTGDSATGARLDLTYSASGVAGTHAHAGAVERIDAQAIGPVIDQRVDWAAVMASDVEPGARFRLSTFERGPRSNQLTGSATETTITTQLLGMQAAIRLDYVVTEGDEQSRYAVIASRELPRLMLREELQGGLVMDLVAIEA